MVARKYFEDGQIQPPFAGPDIGYVARPLLVWAIRSEILVQQIGRNVRCVVAVSRGLVFLGSDGLDVVLMHQTAYTSVPNLQSQLLQFFVHTGAAIAL